MASCTYRVSKYEAVLIKLESLNMSTSKVIKLIMKHPTHNYSIINLYMWTCIIYENLPIIQQFGKGHATFIFISSPWFVLPVILISTGHDFINHFLDNAVK